MISKFKGALAASAFLYAAQGIPPTPAAPETPDPAVQAVAQACTSSRPFVVIDTFAMTKTIHGDRGAPAEADMDFNGDLRTTGGSYKGFDGTHGDIVAAIAGADGRKVIPFQVLDIMPEGLANGFGKLADALESGEIEKPGAVIASLVLPTHIRQMAAQMPFDPRYPEPLTAASLAQDKARVLHFLQAQAADTQNPYSRYYQAYMRIYEAFRRIDALGVPVFLAAGNLGPEPLFNMLAVFPGAHAVGALDRAGAKTSFTNDSSLVRLWRRGSITLRQVEGGIDLNGDGKPEFSNEQLSQERSVAENYNGQAAGEAARSIPMEVRRLAARMGLRGAGAFKNVLPEGLYPTGDLMKLYGLGDTGSASFMEKEGPWMHHPSFMVFKETPEGRLIYDPDGNGDPRQRSSWDATSAAAPNICGN